MDDIQLFLRDKISQLLKEYRENKNLSQGQLAKTLDLTQATVSRLESRKQNISKATVDRIRKTIDAKHLLKEIDFVSGQQIIEEEKVKRELKPRVKGKFGNLGSGFAFAQYTIQSNLRGGDFIKVKELKRSESFAFIVGDSIGHGQGSSYMALALEVSFESILALLNPTTISVSTIERTLSTAVIQTAENWIGEPSLIIGMINTQMGRLEFINRGMPHPLLKYSRGSKYLNEKRYKAIDLLDDSPIGKETSFVDVSQGDSLLLYSDGLTDLLSDEKLETNFQKFSKLFHGDSKAIAQNLLRLINNIAKNERLLNDDISFLVITRKSDG